MEHSFFLGPDSFVELLSVNTSRVPMCTSGVPIHTWSPISSMTNYGLLWVLMDMLLEAHTMAVLVKLTVHSWITASLVAGQPFSPPQVGKDGHKGCGRKSCTTSTFCKLCAGHTIHEAWIFIPFSVDLKSNCDNKEPGICKNSWTL